MTTLAQYLSQRLSAAGFTADDVALVEWDTRDDYGDDESSWIPVDRDTFISTASSVDLSDISADTRTRIRFSIVNDSFPSGRSFVWDGSDFQLVPQRPRIISVTPAMLRAR